MGKVYLLANWDEHKFKIGWTRGSIDKRIKPMQTGNPNLIECVHLFETEHYIKLETWMHNLHGTKRLEGEWFLLTDEDVNNFKQDCQKGHDIFQMLIDSGNPFI